MSWWGKRRKRDHWGDLSVVGWIKIGWIYGKRVVYRVLEWNTEGKRPLGRPRRRWVYNIRMDLWEEGSIYGLVGESIGKETAGET